MLELILFLPLGFLLLVGAIDAGGALWQRSYHEGVFAAATHGAAVSVNARELYRFRDDGEWSYQPQHARLVLTQLATLLREGLGNHFAMKQGDHDAGWRLAAAVVEDSTRIRGECFTMSQGDGSAVFHGAETVECRELTEAARGRVPRTGSEAGEPPSAWCVLSWSTAGTGFGASIFGDTFSGIYRGSGVVMEPIRMIHG